MKKIILFVILLIPILKIDALESYVVMDTKSSRILSSKNMDEKMLIASTTKIMTSLVALENASTTDVLCAGKEVLSVYGSMIYLDIGECMTLYDLLVGLNLRSGNDAAMVIATETIGYDNFIKEMNILANKLEMTSTNFKNPHGLDNETENISTAHDLALLMRYATTNKTFMEITKLKKYMLTSNIEAHIWYNKNELLRSYKFLTGGKIGYTEKAGYMFVSSATKAGENLIVVTMKEKDRFNTHKKLYEEYFKEYDSYKILNKKTFNVKSEYYKSYHLYINEDVEVMLKKDERDKIKIDIDIIKKKKVKDKEVIGKAIVYVDNKYVTETNIFIISKHQKEHSLKSKLFFWKK